VTDPVTPREVTAADIDALVTLEKTAFDTDRLSRRSFRHWIAASNRSFLVATQAGELAGYVLVIYHSGTRLARMYSLATDERFRGRGIARRLIEAAEREAAEDGRFIMRLEVETGNAPALALYESLGYLSFGVYRDYYDDHGDAIRMQKRIHHYRTVEHHVPMPWVPQTTRFTCGPAALMMAMAGIDAGYAPSRREELQIWREATTIFMTSGHGGCHPIGLALAAEARGFSAEAWLNTRRPLFVEGVRDEHKKLIVEMVHNDYVEGAAERDITIRYNDISQNHLIEALDRGAIPLALISTWRLDGRKAPHWVTISGYDEDCLYLHDPDPEKGSQSALDCQYQPVAREDFAKMSSFGGNRLRTAVIVSRGPGRG